LNGTLKETDFDFSGKNRSEKEVIGSVRRKIQILPLISTFFACNLQAEENFSKGSVHCSLATADNQLTMGFVESDVLRPKTLLKKNELESSRSVDVSLILRREKGKEKFDEIVQGDAEAFSVLHPDLYENSQKSNGDTDC